MINEKAKRKNGNVNQRSRILAVMISVSLLMFGTITAFFAGNDNALNAECGDLPASQISIGDTVAPQITDAFAETAELVIYERPNAGQRLGTINDRERALVIAGSHCLVDRDSSARYWRIQTEDGTQGWVMEIASFSDGYLLLPLNEGLMSDLDTKQDIKIRLWSEEDLPLLQRLMGDPKMTEHLGGAETLEKIQQRHTKYCNLRDTHTGKMFAILYGEQEIPVGSIGYWEKTWHDTLVWETGWSVLPEFHGLGIATLATKMIIEAVRSEERHQFLHAFPSINNGASNAICKKVGFRLLGQYEFEYPIGNPMTCNDWQVDLFASP